MVTLLCVVPKIKAKKLEKTEPLAFVFWHITCISSLYESLVFSVFLQGSILAFLFCLACFFFFLKTELKCSAKKLKENIAISRSNPSNRSAFAFSFYVKLILFNSAFFFVGLGSIRFECTSEPWM